MDTIAPLHETGARSLARTDLDAVVAIDARLEGRTRRAYFERRLASALRDPSLHLQLAIDDGDGLAGYVLGRVADGDFGREALALRLETIGVRPDAKGRNVGGRLLDALAAKAVKRGIRELRTAARWNDHSMLRWLDEHGFALARNHVVERPIDSSEIDAPVDRPVTLEAGTGPGREIDYGAPEGNDYERLARDTCDVRSMTRADLGDAVRIDRASTGRDREGAIGRKLAEALEESGLRVSLTARLDDVIVGFLMARADLGDFGRTEPAAVLDTIAVDPAYQHRGVGHALLSQLLLNLGALRIDRVETVVAPRDLGLLGFLFDVGFVPSPRLPFVRALG
ncbi:MAG: GNAT family N-acetyltransferase [Burkholderiales bacterium]|jgi:ribosomal protein S18 acetylase RimI-like enzyme|nr:GNAT family N-acetyltransferase [Burkholderiales bacterium]